MPVSPAELPAISHVAETIRLATAPVFLLAGVGAFLNLCASRLARIIDRTRIVEDLITRTYGADHDRYVHEIRTLDRRINIVNFAILQGVIGACLICLVVILLFANQMFNHRLDTAIALLFIGAMMAMACGFMTFIVETRISSSLFKVRNEILYHKADDGKNK